ncbi:hypothetical protein KUCAC02_029968, partial [Chaenocephalus aceratus]
RPPGVRRGANSPQSARRERKMKEDGGGWNREDIRTVRERGGDGDRERRGEQRGGVCCDQVHTV